ncbi:DNA translocase FtsK [Tabrizicola sp.]|uniref:DNA translocase FtsK n=1 Tax=Tabrizicola sp. TaxID=2005166 RepID=UPI00286B337F|nr:DNA translocase FtsK [Tabrizicola sp.]
MASYQARQRDPLLDQSTQAMLERRGRELMGLVLVLLGLGFLMALGSYSPDDPGWMVATDEPAQNMLGRLGAAIASTLMIIIGSGAWAIPVILMVWGGRFILHRGGERALGRVVFAVIAVALASVYAATLVPGAAWPQSFGLGGLFGDTVLGSLLGVMPGSAGFGLKLLSFGTFAALIAMMLYVTGFDTVEMTAIWRFLLIGSIMGYSALRSLAGSGARGAVHGALSLQARTLQARSRSAVQPGLAAPSVPSRRPPPVVGGPRPALAPEPLAVGTAWNAPATLRNEQRHFTAPAELPKEKLGFLARMRRAVEPEPELVEPLMSATAWAADLPTEDRIKARISDVIRNRGQRAPVAAEPPLARAEPSLARVEPPVMRPRQPQYPAPQTPIATISDPTLMTVDWEDDTVPDNMFAADSDWSDDDDLAPLNPALTGDRRPMVQHAARKAAPSRQALAESQPALRFEDSAPVYELPPLSLLSNPTTIQRTQLSDEALEENARMLESVLDDYGVKGEITSVRPGPVVTMYELEPAPGLKASRVIGLADDIARSMSALSARVSTVPGRTVIGIELPNAVREKVVLKEILSARDFGDSQMRLPLALGKDIGGDPIVANLAKMPHLLIAGTTGSGKSVAINTMILSLLYKLSPDECRMIMIDPKMLELSVYDGIPHLLSPVVTDPKKAVVALKWVVGEMEERYRKMSKMGVRNIEGYNGRVREALSKNEMFKRTIQTGFDEETGDPIFETDEFQPVTIPYIVVIVDEMADLMMVAGKEIEACIQRLAQMARASGIHLIMATQRPSVDVITGTIKANFPTRISFQVTSKIDSRTILGEQGAEQLLGMGDMLYMGNGSKITRIHGPFVSDEEVEEIVNHLKSYGPPVYMSGVVESVDDERDNEIDLVLGLNGEGDDSLYDQAVAIVAKDRKCSTSYIQRKLGIGYNKAAKLVEQMEDQGVVTRANHVGKREILVEER